MGTLQIPQNLNDVRTGLSQLMGMMPEYGHITGITGGVQATFEGGAGLPQLDLVDTRFVYGSEPAELAPPAPILFFPFALGAKPKDLKAVVDAGRSQLSPTCARGVPSFFRVQGIADGVGVEIAKFMLENPGGDVERFEEQMSWRRMEGKRIGESTADDEIYCGLVCLAKASRSQMSEIAWLTGAAKMLARERNPVSKLNAAVLYETVADAVEARHAARISKNPAARSMDASSCKRTKTLRRYAAQMWLRGASEMCLPSQWQDDTTPDVEKMFALEKLAVLRGYCNAVMAGWLGISYEALQIYTSQSWNHGLEGAANYIRLASFITGAVGSREGLAPAATAISRAGYIWEGKVSGIKAELAKRHSDDLVRQGTLFKDMAKRAKGLFIASGLLAAGIDNLWYLEGLGQSPDGSSLFGK